MKKLAAAVAAGFLLCACAGPEPISKNGFLLDTTVTITLYDSGDTGILEDAFALCEAYERRFSRTDPGSEVWALNHAGGEWTPVSGELRAVILRAVAYSEATGGRYDITICPVVDLWDFRAEIPSLPDPAALAAALRRVDSRNIVLEGESARLKNGAQIDLGSIAKGYIADHLAEFLRGRGVGSAIINLGGNVVTVGAKPSGEPFRIGIQKPFGPRNETIGTVEVTDRSVVSSGVYERSFRLEGTLYHHILDPETGYPAESDLSAVTVISESSMDGDALSTCCFLLGSEAGMALIESLPDTEAFFLLNDGGELFSSGFGTSLPFIPAE